jgi:N-formylglutamate amidohydrolase
MDIAIQRNLYQLKRTTASTPEIGIGTDPFFTSAELINLTENYFKSLGFEVGLNEPFQGTIVPNKIYEARDKCVQSVMIEIRRDLYIDESTAQKNSGFNAIKKAIHGYRQAVAQFVSTV